MSLDDVGVDDPDGRHRNQFSFHPKFIRAHLVGERPKARRLRLLREEKELKAKETELKAKEEELKDKEEAERIAKQQHDFQTRSK